MNISKEEININSVILRREDINVSDLNGEKVMMDLNGGKYFALNKVGSRVWDIIDNKISIGDVVNILMREYDIDEKICIEEVISFIKKMNNAKIIKLEAQI